MWIRTIFGHEKAPRGFFALRALGTHLAGSTDWERESARWTDGRSRLEGSSVLTTRVRRATPIGQAIRPLDIGHFDTKRLGNRLSGADVGLEARVGSKRTLHGAVTKVGLDGDIADGHTLGAEHFA